VPRAAFLLGRQHERDEFVGPCHQIGIAVLGRNQREQPRGERVDVDDHELVVGGVGVRLVALDRSSVDLGPDELTGLRRDPKRVFVAGESVVAHERLRTEDGDDHRRVIRRQEELPRVLPVEVVPPARGLVVR